ncbi:MAG: hydroxymethylbilane synthase [Tissierellia bacterium]|nr:hydroxymethylbilane synthase [Tissierellia bacterium]
MKIKIGSRASKLALIQAESIKELLDKNGYETEIIKISTKGDRVLDRPIDKIGGFGVFSREIEKKLLEKEIDLAIHSLKDLPSILQPGLELAKPPKAHDARDVFVGKEIITAIEQLNNKKIATSSIRRRELLDKYFKDIEITGIRGNIDTRLKKVEEEDIDGAIFAKAGLDRIGFNNDYFILDPEIFIPAPCQGILGIEFRSEDTYIRDFFDREHDEFSAFRMQVERSFQKELSATCSSPLGIYTKLMGDRVELIACFKKDLDENLRIEKISGHKDDAISLAKNLAKIIRK